MEYFLDVVNVRKAFSSVVANDDVNFRVLKGEVHAILGENGAGKSTLMKILCGLYQPDQGEVKLEGQTVHFQSPRDAIRAGIGMVHQHFMLIPALTVAENIVLGDEPGAVNYDKTGAIEKVKHLSERYQLHIDPKAKVADLAVGLQQRVEILKVLYRNAKMLILDEPTALLTPQESEQLFEVVANFKKQGMPVIFISHKLDEVKSIADRVTVMRAGRTVGSHDVTDLTVKQMANLMVGRDVVFALEKQPQRIGDIILEVNDLLVKDVKKHHIKVNNISLQVRKGEIVGVAGIDGNGQVELIDAITGLHKISGGSIRFNGREISRLSSSDRVRAGMAYVPQDRQLYGLVLPFNIVDNMILRDVRRKPFSNWGFLRKKVAASYTKPLMDEYDIRPRDPYKKAEELSGGNQQKVILAREVSRDPDLLIVAQPTRGMDVGAIEHIHQQLLRLRDEGKAILLVSLELDEILSLSDRIAVLHEGKIVDIVSAEKISREQVGLLMMGQSIEKYQNEVLQQ
ncbi:ABC transporter ATP-binding protein [Paenibacillus alginolyticus]|uniref:ABC transporter ATP-binding protein n=1 Tax=Paenibacillus alginolyticus TaxID=59839 RepID=A0ABT4GAH2_9BACL|nr:ABC transporter ATP-binding protein [Paenibacillus alginolyticus]MCY9693195.1 ABC transporter ATP-binding protein [Paenibacillus alginolyticus]MEC0144510.1 ABC transporter ATP-binding protein [Paenibacillus alginolyticus]